MSVKKPITDKEVMDFYQQNHLLDEAAVATPIVADGEAEKTLPVEEEPDLARSFNRNYNVYFPSQGYGTTFMNDNNWYNETSLTVTFYSSQGPTSLGFVVTAVNKSTGQQQLF